MKLAPTSVSGPALVQPTGKLQALSSVTTISFLNAKPSNFLNVVFMRPTKRMIPKFIVRQNHSTTICNGILNVQIGYSLIPLLLI